MADKFSISPTEIHRLQGQISRLEPDFVSVEEPLEIQLLIDGDATPKSISITMRTPGNDLALAIGFLYTEGIIRMVAISNPTMPIPTQTEIEYVWKSTPMFHWTFPN
ncbi:MAG: hypothetical protein ACKO67_07015 [Bacteroidota bacterium]